jgi:hypothetical protein
MSVMEPLASQPEESALWDGIHPPSEVYSPPAKPRHLGIGASPMSNLADHPNFHHPYPHLPGDHSVPLNDHDHASSTAPSFGESNFSEAHMRDIHAQHAGLQGFDTHNRNAASPHEAEPEHANGPTEDEPGADQATPVDGSNPSASK